MDVLSALRMHAAERPSDIALTDGTMDLCFADVKSRVDALAAWLADRGCRRLGLFMDNGLDWVLLDLAARSADIVLVPIPLFFSKDQIRHVISTAALDHMATDQVERLGSVLEGSTDSVELPHFAAGRTGRLVPLALWKSMAPVPLPGRTRKVTFTSGTTGRPKGVCLSHAAIDRVASSLLTASDGRWEDKHLCLLPLATLLENIAGVYVPLLAGAMICVPPLSTVGLVGSSQLDVGALLVAVLRFRASTVVMVPQMLLALMAATSPDAMRRSALRLIAVGGAPLPAEALRKAEQMGLPVRQGYGLSECSSVVTFNTVSDNRIGSVGRPLPHADVRIAPDGEILVRGAVCEGFLGEPDVARPLYWPTGDVGAFDADGYLHLTGRKKHMFITSFGRNVAPEWIECELTVEPAIAQAAVFGEARPWNAAIIVPRLASNRQPADPSQVAAAIQRANARLPDYGHVRRWIVADAPFTPENQLMTPNGRLRRDAIARAYEDRINRLYDDEALRVS
ncbi:MAG: AMP-binding protein [Dongiaceae bacterium]